MAGGVMILLGLTLAEGEPHKARFIGTGMHGGVIYLRGSVEEHQLGKEVGVAELEETDIQLLKDYVGQFAGYFDYNADEIMKSEFVKLFPRWLRPYGRLYAY
jgi:glutamate synthase domain-containing protein 3